MPDREVDVRPLPSADRHPAIFAAFDELRVGESFVLVSDHPPQPVCDELEADRAGAYGWEDLESGPQVWRARVSRLAATSQPRVLCDTAAAGDPDATGAV